MKSFIHYLKESQITEGKQEYLKKYSSEPDVKTVVNQFWTIRQRLKNPENDIDWWIKKPYNEFKQFVLKFDVTKNKKTRQQDKYIKKAEEFGAVMFGNFGLYEAWFVPTYEAAVQLGRFYKNVSTKWCISTDSSNYFNDHCYEYEFVFLISDNTSLKNNQKLAIQIDTEDDNIVDVWDIRDDKITNELKQLGLKDVIDKVFKAFKKLNRSRHDDITKQILDKHEEMYKNDANNAVQKKLKSLTKISDGDISEKYIQYITNISIPNNIKIIDDDSFSYCQSLKEITIPNSVKSIGKWAFNNCQSLKEITIPNSVISIGKQAFNGCISLKEITISNSVKSINDGTFSQCKSLKSITIPNSVISIGEGAFFGCESLKQVIFSSNSPLLNDIKNKKYQNWRLKRNQIYIKKAN